MEAKNISNEFERMDIFEFDKFLLNLNRWTQSELFLTIHTDDISKAKRLKAIKENMKFTKLHFQCEIKATVEEYQKELNVFASGIKWIEKK